MKKHLFSVFVWSSLAIMAQTPPAIKWQKSYGGTSADNANSIKQTTDGGYIVAGASTSTNGDITLNKGTYDYWVTKIDSTGTLQWEKTLGGSGDDEANAVIQTMDGGYVVVGFSNSADSNITNPKGQYDVWVVKLNGAGSVKWQKSLGGTAPDQAWDIQQTTDKGYIIAAGSASNNYDLTLNNGQSDFWVVKTDSLGAIQWQTSLGGSGVDIARSVQQTSDGGYIIAGQSTSTNGDVTGNYGNVDFWVTRLSSTGTLQWEKSLGGTAADVANSIKQTTDGGYIVAGKTKSNDGIVTGNNGSENVWLIKLSSTGTVSWEKCYGGTLDDYAMSVSQCSDGGYIFAGTATSNTLDVSGNNGGNDYWTVKTYSTGAIEWQKCLGGTGSDHATSIQITSDNGYVVAGTSTSTNGDVTVAKGQNDYWVVKFVGTVVTQTTTSPPPTGIAEITANSSRVSVYPNPGDGLITVTMDAPLLAQLSSLQIITTMGQLVYETDLKQSEVRIDFSGNLAKGIYFLQLKNSTGSLVATKKLLIN